MATPTPIAKLSIGKSGLCRKRELLRTRKSALDPDCKERQRSREEYRDEQMSLLTHDERTQGQPNATETLDENLNERSLDQTKEQGGAYHTDADPVWT